VLLVTGGRLGDIFGRRKMFLFGVVTFGLSSAFIGFSQTEAWLVAGRAVQGVGAAFMMPATLSIIANAFPAHERGKAIGTWAGVSALALAIGPVVGGFLVENVSWQSIFFLNVPVAALAVFVTLAATRESRDEASTHQVDYAGVATLSIGLAALVLALVEGNSWGWGSASIIALLVVAAAGLIGFAIAERRVAEPMVDFTFFRSRSFLGANLVAFIVSFAMLAMFFFLALYLQNINGYSPLQAGVRFLRRPWSSSSPGRSPGACRTASGRGRSWWRAWSSSRSRCSGRATCRSTRATGSWSARSCSWAWAWD
jgi:EmrB/QacA subfamily drug resistance transporter